MLKVALTGGIGAGKSQVAALFEEMGAMVIDSDQLARKAIERGSPGFDEVVEIFGDEILTNGDIDRSKLASVIFKDASKRNHLESIIHPRVRREFEKIANSLPSGTILINEIPLLVETGARKNFDLIINVTAPDEQKWERLMSRGMSPHEIEDRKNSQASDIERNAISDFIIDNSGDLMKLRTQVENIYKKLLAKCAQ